MTPSFWKGKRVFLTGHTGFKGSWLTIWLHQLGAVVRGYSLPAPTSPSIFEAGKVADLCDHVIGDVRDGVAVEKALREFKPEIVIHMAAQPLVRLSYDQPVETFETNVMGTVNVLQAVRNCSTVRAVVNVTSDKCYENREWLWGYRETEAMGGHDPYSASKGCAELVASAFARSYFNNDDAPLLASGRAGNVIGGGDWALDRLVPDIMRAFLAGKAVELRQPDSVRPWQHVLEPLAGYMTLAEALVVKGRKVTGGWNFGPPSEAVKSVRAVADEICKQWGKPCRWIDVSDPNAVHEAKLLQLDSTKARMELQWLPRWSIEEALGATIEWYQGAQDTSRVRSLCEKQIQNFMVAR